MTRMEIPMTDKSRKVNRILRWLSISLATLAMLLTVAIALLPVAIRLGAIDWLEKHGVENAEIVNVDLNPFTGTFAIDGLKADDGFRIDRLAIDIDWWPMWDRDIDLRSLTVSGVVADIKQLEDGTWQLSSIRPDAVEAGDATEDSTGDAQPWQVILNRIDLEKVDVRVRGKSGGEKFDASLNLDSLTLALNKREADGTQWLDNRIRLGKTSFSGFGLKAANGTLKLEQSLKVPAMGGDMVSGFGIQDLKLGTEEFSLADKDTGMQLIAVDHASVDSLDLQGSGTVSLAKLAIQGILLPAQDARSLGSVDSVELDRLEASIAAGKEKGTFERLNISGISLPADVGKSLGKVDSVDFQDGEFDAAGHFSLNKLRVEGVQAALLKRKNGKLDVLDNLLEVSTATTSAPPEASGDSPAAEAKAPVIRVGEFSLGKGSNFSYRDESLFPPFDTKVVVERMSLKPVDLSGEEKGNLDASFKLNKNGTLTVSGDLVPSSAKPGAKLKVVMKNFDMPGLTGFVEGDFGQAIKTGQMDMTSDIKVASGKIDAKNKLKIRKLELEKSAQPGKAEQGLGMPVDMALDMLRDDKGDIEMDVPVSGRLDDPDINVNDVINTALVSAMKGSAMTYAKLALQPYGAILMAGEFALGKAKNAAKPKLTPIQFNERSDSLGPEMADYASKIAALMQQKDFRLQICGIATRIEGGGATPDRPRILDDERMMQLAESRSDAVMKAIQDHGIAPDRLFNCRPSIDERKKDALPRVEMILD